MEQGLRVVTEPEEMPTAEDGQIEGARLSDETQSADESGKRERSSIAFPYNDLTDAEQVAREVHRQGGFQCTVDQLAFGLKHDNVKSGTFRLKLSASRIFGLIRLDREQVALTDIGKLIIDPEQVQQARVWSFLNVPLYRAIFEKYRGYTLPRVTALEAEMQTLGVSPKVTDKARQVFQRSAEQAGMLAPTKDRLVVPPNTTTEREVISTSNPTSWSEGVVLPSSGSNDSGHAKPASEHYFIRTLLRGLPPIGTPWSEAEQEEWLESMRIGFHWLYNSSQRQR